MKRAIITVGLGFGDEGKGATVDFLCRQYGAGLVVRYSGGCQAGHNVQLEDGRRHCFSQFGAGTLAGVPTYLGPDVIIDPLAAAREADHLKELGVSNPYDFLYVDSDCLVTTAYHQALNRFKEHSRGNQKHGSCGMGIGETRSYWLRYGNDSVFAGDLGNYQLLQSKLRLLRERVLLEINDLRKSARGEELGFGHGLHLSVQTVAAELHRNVLDFNPHVPGDLLFSKNSVVVFEGAQGVLLDEWYGFHPYTTWSTVTPANALDLCRQWGAEGVCVLGITRTYATRHGQGPLPTYDKELTEKLQDPGNPENDWQGRLRCGYFDMVLGDYAYQICRPDGIVVNHLDQDPHQLCHHYKVYGAPDVYRLESSEMPDLSRQFEIGSRFQFARPSYCSGSIMDHLWVDSPVNIAATGPTAKDRTLIKELVWRKL